MSAAQGVVLTGWLVIEMILMRAIAFLHVLYLVVALVIIVAGWRMLPEERATAGRG